MKISKMIGSSVDLENGSLKFIVTIFSAAIVGSWLIFGFIWWSVALTRNKLRSSENVPAQFFNGTQDQLPQRENEATCLEGVPNVVEALIFSVESQTTIGYGTRILNPDCLETIVLLMVQLIIGCFIEGITAGLFSQNLNSILSRKKILKFGDFVALQKAKDDEVILIFKLLRLTQESLSKVKIVATVTHSEGADSSSESEEDPDELSVMATLNEGFKSDIDFKKYNLPLSYDKSCSRIDLDFVLFQWPMSLYHKIDKNSSLWKMRNKLENISEPLVIILTIECFVGRSGIPHKSSKHYSASDLKSINRGSPTLFTKNDRGVFMFDGVF